MKRLALSALALFVFVAGVATADRFTSTTGSLIRIEGTSTLHAWKMEGSIINGQIAAPSLERWQDGSATVSVAIPVTSIKSEHAKMDKLMTEALKAKENPEIRYVLTSAALENPAEQTFAVKTRGKLTIAGITRDVNMTVAGVREGARYILTGEAPIRMSDFGIKPPTAMLGTIKTGNDVKVTFRWLVEPTAN